MVVSGLIWDDWNREHLTKHKITIEEVDEVFHGEFKVIKSYRKRMQISGKTRKGKQLTIILSPENRDFKVYGDDIFYPITAFEEVDL